MIEESFIKSFQDQIVTWQQQHGRHQLPWQQQSSPYHVLVSELMLQQTQVITVIPYFERWMIKFPTIERLAAASTDEVMAAWQGLGYYARARNLHKAAQYITALGVFPQSLAELLAVPGVGRYTAGAIRSFAYNAYGPIVDGNVRRFYARYFAIDGVTTSSAVDKKLWALAEQLTPQDNCRSFAQGLLDLGATICKPRQPLCEQCPVASSCQALAQNRVDTLPTAKPKKVIPTKAGHFLWIERQQQLYLELRPAVGIWPSLWALPELTLPPLPQQIPQQSVAKRGQFLHQFSHYKLEASVWQASADAIHQVQQTGSGRWFSLAELAEVGLPAPIRVFITAQLQLAAEHCSIQD